MSGRGSETRDRPRPARLERDGLERDAPQREGLERDAPQREGLERDAYAFVFCGGASTRMGRDKARLAWGRTTLVERAAAVLAEVSPRVLLLPGSEARYPELGFEQVLDEASTAPGGGPLAGLAAALARIPVDEGVEYACVLACDMPAARADVFRALLARARESDADVCLVATDAGPEPLCAVVHARCLAAVRAALARGERRMIAFHPGLRVVAVDALELGGAGAGCSRNVNTPEEYRAALAEGGPA